MRNCLRFPPVGGGGGFGLLASCLANKGFDETSGVSFGGVVPNTSTLAEDLAPPSSAEYIREKPLETDDRNRVRGLDRGFDTESR